MQETIIHCGLYMLANYNFKVVVVQGVDIGMEEPWVLTIENLPESRIPVSHLSFMYAFLHNDS